MTEENINYPFIHKPNSHNWYYCIDKVDPILPSQVPYDLRCNWLSYSRDESEIESYKSAEDYAGLTDSTVGKWMIFPNRTIFPRNADEAWPRLLEETAIGNLGIGIKASTTYNRRGKLICVYTYDELDDKDTIRVYEALRALNITGILSYKPDWITNLRIEASIWTAMPGEQPHRSERYWEIRDLINSHDMKHGRTDAQKASRNNRILWSPITPKDDRPRPLYVYHERSYKEVTKEAREMGIDPKQYKAHWERFKYINAQRYKRSQTRYGARKKMFEQLEAEFHIIIEDLYSGDLAREEEARFALRHPILNWPAAITNSMVQCDKVKRGWDIDITQQTAFVDAVISNWQQIGEMTDDGHISNQEAVEYLLSDKYLAAMQRELLESPPCEVCGSIPAYTIVTFWKGEAMSPRTLCEDCYEDYKDDLYGEDDDEEPEPEENEDDKDGTR